MKKIIIAACAAVLAQSASAQAWRAYVHRAPSGATSDDCPQIKPIMIGGMQGYVDRLSSGICYVSIDPTSTPGLVYRSYAFFSDGLMMVFNSYGEGNNPNLTSAREFFFFPRRGAPILAMDPKAGTASVRMSDGGRADFDPPSAQISGFERGAVTVASRIDRADQGGVKIPRYSGLMLDAGFRLGESPSGLPDGTSTFRDAAGLSCRVKNSDIFEYADGDRALKFTDAKLSEWLKTACPDLNAGF